MGLLRARVWLVARDRRDYVDFLIDPAIEWTVIATADLRGFGALPLDDSSHVAGVFGVALGLRTTAFLTFDLDDGGAHLETIEVVLATGAEGTSRLGRDILNRWLMIYDPQGDNLSFYPYADNEEDGDASAR